MAHTFSLVSLCTEIGQAAEAGYRSNEMGSILDTSLFQMLPSFNPYSSFNDSVCNFNPDLQIRH